jgi:hypothetical protein
VNYLALAAALSRLDNLEVKLNRLSEAVESPFGDDSEDSDARVLKDAVEDVRQIRATLAGGGA